MRLIHLICLCRTVRISSISCICVLFQPSLSSSAGRCLNSSQDEIFTGPGGSMRPAPTSSTRRRKRAGSAPAGTRSATPTTSPALVGAGLPERLVDRGLKRLVVVFRQQHVLGDAAPQGDARPRGLARLCQRHIALRRAGDALDAIHARLGEKGPAGCAGPPTWTTRRLPQRPPVVCRRRVARAMNSLKPRGEMYWPSRLSGASSRSPSSPARSSASRASLRSRLATMATSGLPSPASRRALAPADQRVQHVGVRLHREFERNDARPRRPLRAIRPARRRRPRSAGQPRPRRQPPGLPASSPGNRSATSRRRGRASTRPRRTRPLTR